MSIVLNGRCTTDTVAQRMHYVPCRIDHSGEANIEEYFDSTIRDAGEDGEMTASFRGRPLNGTKFEVPEGYQGVIFSEKNRPFSEDKQRHFHISGKFDEFTLWNLDQKPSKNDKLIKAMTWLKLAEAIHCDPENDDDLEVDMEREEIHNDAVGNMA